MGRRKQPLGWSDLSLRQLEVALASGYDFCGKNFFNLQLNRLKLSVIRLFLVRTVLVLATTLLINPLLLNAQVQPSSGSENARFTLSDALQALEAENPLLAAARYQIDAAAGDAVAAGLWDNPTVSLTDNRGVGKTAYETPTEFDWSVSQGFDVFGMRAAARKAGLFERDATRSDYNGLLASLRLQVERSLAELAAALQRSKLSEENFQRLEAAFQIVRSRVEAGAEPRYDLHRMALGLADARADLEAARTSALQQRAQFDIAVGPGASRLIGIPDYSLTAEKDIPVKEGLIAILNERPDIVGGKLRILSAAASVSAAKRGVWPSIDLSVGNNCVYSTPKELSLVIGLNFNIPILDHGQGTIAAARARHSAAAATVQAIADSALKTLETTYNVMLVQRRAYVQYRETTLLNDDSMLHEALAAYVGGLIEILDLVDAYSSYNDTRMREIDLLLAAREAELDVLVAATAIKTQ